LAAADTHLGVEGVSASGPELRRRYVTTATEDWSDEQRRCEPLAGLVYRCATEATGLPAAPFRPGRCEDLTQ
jgi:sugar lactone lactonase YvrE